MEKTGYKELHASTQKTGEEGMVAYICSIGDFDVSGDVPGGASWLAMAGQ